MNTRLSVLGFAFSFISLSLTGSVLADTNYDLAESLGNLIAAEEFCDLSYNQDAIVSFIEQKVPADDLEFANYLDTSIRLSSDQLNEMSGSRKTAFCTQIRRTAKHYGFSK
ncbi:hypothetical protein [uncultured Cohaesibacter sp.]|uniref:hypothetical protein n=1 Tax=uncultured Cohaesibacter sp. TaxID=1002546 RepID=UPI002AABE55C|nr:hypothetical protein [uncultured Cohaesibacter sp.]